MIFSLLHLISYSSYYAMIKLDLLLYCISVHIIDCSSFIFIFCNFDNYVTMLLLNFLNKNYSYKKKILYFYIIGKLITSSMCTFSIFLIIRLIV